MKYKYIALTILILGVMASCIGCGGSTASNPTATPTETGVQPVPTEQLATPPMNVSWISPGKVEVGDFYAGASAEYPLRVHNGNDVPTLFLVTCRLPDNTATGYVIPQPDAVNWITVTGAETPLQAYETRDVMVSLNMPADGLYPAPKWELWVSVVDSSQEGFVHTELCSRWLITME